MKKITTTLFLLIIIQGLFAQNLSKTERFNNNILSQYSTYFSGILLNEKNQLEITATNLFSELNTTDKQNIMNILVKEWQESFVIIVFNTKRELWGWSPSTDKAILVDSWDLNSVVKSTVTDHIERTNQMPWFFYIGGMNYFDTDSNINGALNAHVGVFLLKNKWDVALTFSESIQGNIDDETSSIQAGIGAMTRLHFPIKKYNLSPNVGVQLTTYLTASGDDAAVFSLTPSLLVGIGWYVGIGSIDASVSIGKNFVATVGYTFMPKFKKKKK